MKAREQYEDYVKSSALERKEKELENAQKWQALKQKEDYLRSKGYLPPKPVPPPFVYNGVSYANWAEFKNSKAYTEEYLKDLEEKFENNVNQLVEASKSKIYSDLETELWGIENEIRRIDDISKTLSGLDASIMVNHPIVSHISSELTNSIQKLRERVDNNLLD